MKRCPDKVISSCPVPSGETLQPAGSRGEGGRRTDDGGERMVNKNVDRYPSIQGGVQQLFPPTPTTALLCCRSAQRCLNIYSLNPLHLAGLQEKKRSKWVGGNGISDENSSCKEPELEREERWKLLFNPTLSTRNWLQFIEAAMDIFSAAHFKPNYLKACTWTSRFWIRGERVGEKKHNKIKEGFFMENWWYAFRHPCVFLTTLENIKRGHLETRL